MLTPQPYPQPYHQPPRRRGPLLVAVAAVVVAAGVAVWGLVAQVTAGVERDDAERAVTRAQERLDETRADQDLALARGRDEVAEAARHAVAVMNTLDHRTVEEDLAAWAEVTTGPLREEVTGLGEDQRAQLRDAGSTSVGEVVSVAVRDLDTRAGTATVLAAVTVSVTVGDGEPDDRHQRIQASLEHTDDGWKLSAIGQVPFSEAGS